MSNNTGATWSITEPTSSPVEALAAAQGIIYAGLENGQVLVYVSGVWIPTTPTTIGEIWSLAVNPANAQNAFAVEWSSYQNPDVYVTQNQGTSWTVLNTTPCPVQFLAFDSAGAVLYAGCDGALWESTNGGNSWTQIIGPSWDIRLITTDFTGISSSLAVGSDQGIYSSSNSGSTWQSLNGKITSSILFGLAVQGSTILTSVQDFSPISSFDGGKTWSNLESGAAVGESGTVLFNPGNTKYAYFFTTSGFFYSTNGGKTFTSDSQLPSNEFPQSAGNGDLIGVDLKNPSTVYVAAVDGVFKSTNWGISWTRQSSWQISQPVMVAVDPTNSSHIFVGQLNGALMFSSNGGTSWMQSTLACTNCGSPTSLAVDPSNSQNVLIGMSQPPPNGGILVSTNGGASFVQANSGISVNSVSNIVCQAAAVPHLRFDPSGSGLMAAATNSGAYTSSNLGTNWSSISGNAVPYAFTDLVWSGGNLYASTCGEGILRMSFSQ
jgi:photosystem II stability/assembly factor-like uncharacterized protein